MQLKNIGMAPFLGVRTFLAHLKTTFRFMVRLAHSIASNERGGVFYRVRQLAAV